MTKKNSLKEFTNILRTLQEPTPEEVTAFRKELLAEVLFGESVMADARKRRRESERTAERAKAWFATLSDSERDKLVVWLRREKEQSNFEDELIGYIVGGDNLDEI